MKKILVSGCGGYVGNTLCRHLLAEGYKVRGLDNFHKGQCDALFSIANDPNFEFVYGDVTNMQDCKNASLGVDGIIHLAAIVGFPACARQPALAKAVNVEGTQNMLYANPSVPFVFASTGSVYGKVEDICTEDSPMNSVSLYGQTKIKAENLVTAGQNTVAFRFATGFGVSPCMRVNLLVNDLVYRALTERSINIFQPDFQRTFIHVKDMARCFTWGLEGLWNNTLNYKVYNAGDKNLNWSKRQLAEYIKEKTNCYLTYNDSATDADQRDYSVNFDRLNKDGFDCEYSMQKGIDELIKVTPLLQIRHQYE